MSPLFGKVGDLLVTELRANRWTRFTAIVAFARMSGVAHVEPHLAGFTASGSRADLTVGTDLRATTYEAAWYLMHAVAANGRMLLASSEPGATFHPKIFLFSDAHSSEPDAVDALRAATTALSIVGSANLTGGGLYTNDEASLVWEPDLGAAGDKASWNALVDAIAPWLDPTDPLIVATAAAGTLAAETRAGRLPREVALLSTRPRGARTSGSTPRSARRRLPRRPPLTGPPPPPPGPPTKKTPPGLSVLIARLAFGSSRRWPQWELNADVLNQFFAVTAAGGVIQREAVTQAGVIRPAASTPLVIGIGRNRRLEFPEPDGRPDPYPHPALLVVVDRRPSAFRYAVLLPGDPLYPAVDALNQASPGFGQYVATTKRTVVTYADLVAVWPGCPL